MKRNFLKLAVALGMLAALSAPALALIDFDINSKSPGRVVINGTIDAETDGTISAQVPTSTRVFTASKNGTGVYRVTLHNQYQALISASASLESNTGYTVALTSDQSATSNKYVEFTVASTGGDSSSDAVTYAKNAGQQLHLIDGGDGFTDATAPIMSTCPDANGDGALFKMFEQFGAQFVTHMNDATPTWHSAATTNSEYIAASCAEDSVTDDITSYTCLAAIVADISLHCAEDVHNGGYCEVPLPLSVLSTPWYTADDGTDYFYAASPFTKAQTIELNQCVAMRAIYSWFANHQNSYAYVTAASATGTSTDLTSGAIHFNLVLRETSLDY